ncbi:hypothetical protein FOA52_005545 [Chlamydomonas sp. UWO 241]|nr:hypothetical protein FOA52_005545 [Chlamydomonas sp. UWO 241]
MGAVKKADVEPLPDQVDAAITAVRLRLRHIVASLLNVLIACGIVHEALAAVNGGSGVPTTPQRALLLTALLFLSHEAYVLVSRWNIAHRWTPDEAADYALSIMIAAPIVLNTLSVFALSEQGFNDVQRSWPAHMGATLMASIVVHGNKPQHSMLQILFFAPWITWMEYYQCCSLSSSCTKLGLLAHAMTALPKCLIIGLSICTAGHVMFINWCVARDRDAFQRQAHALPLSSLFKINAPARVPGLATLLSGYQAAVLWLSDNVSHSALVRCVSVPGLAYYIFMALWARFNPCSMSTNTVTVEEFFLAMFFAFFVGRDSTTLDLGDMQRVLKRSIAIMSDLVPEHVMNVLLQAPDGPCPSVHPRQQVRSQNGEVARQDASSRAEPVVNDSPRSDCDTYSVPGMQSARSTESGGSFSSSRSALLPGALSVELRKSDRGGLLLASTLDVRTPRQSMNSLAATSLQAPEDALLGRRTATKNASLRSVTGFFTNAYNGRPSSDSGAMRAMLSVKQYLASGSTSSCGDSVEATPLAADREGAHFNVSEWHECVTIFFSDIVGFSSWAHDISPEKVMHTLNDLYSRLDNIIVNEMPSLYKVETIGDSYMCAANLLQRDPEHAATMIRFALRAQEEAAKVPTPTGDGTMLKMRCGIHSGPAMSGIVGKIRRRFCLFGSTVNMASRTESSCPEGAIQVTSTCLDLAMPHLPPYVIVTERGPVVVKGSTESLLMSLITKDENAPRVPFTASPFVGVRPPVTKSLSAMDFPPRVVPLVLKAAPPERIFSFGSSSYTGTNPQGSNRGLSLGLTGSLSPLGSLLRETPIGVLGSIEATSLDEFATPPSMEEGCQSTDPAVAWQGERGAPGGVLMLV